MTTSTTIVLISLLTAAIMACLFGACSEDEMHEWR